VIGFFDDVRVRSIEIDEVRRFDPDLRSFFNANTPEAAEEARRLLTLPDGGTGPERTATS
jgi:molybdopterin-guanine dinucleotide biosynthesis protein A